MRQLKQTFLLLTLLVDQAHYWLILQLMRYINYLNTCLPTHVSKRGDAYSSLLDSFFSFRSCC